MPEVTVDVAGRSYRLGCGVDEEEHLTGLAVKLDTEARGLLRQFGQMTDRMRDYLWRARRALSAKGFDHYRHLAVLRENCDELHIVRRDRVDPRDPVCISDSIRDLRQSELPYRVQHARGPRPQPQPEAYARYAKNLLKGLKRSA